MEYQNFTSLPPDQERQFVIYEQTSVESRKKAMTFGAIAGAIVGVVALMLFFAYDAPRNAHAVDMPSELEEEEVAPAPAAAPAPVEAEPAAEEAPAEEVPAEAAAMEAPEPPKGATKAPPTALIGQ